MTASTSIRPGLAALLSSRARALLDRAEPSVVQIQSAGRGAGAGFVWAADGAILTNDHVVAHAGDSLQVMLADGRVFDAEVAARNSALDLALLTIRAGGLPPLARGDSEAARVGELVFAIGHPWGQPGVVTAGVISGLGALPVGRSGRTAHYIRTDVRLAPGNSGGPLLDAAGNALGVNAMIFGGDLAVAIPIHVAREWIISAADELVDRF
ncbi:MAG TPA: trypsin-like peptidase domain-containing protein [Herpetosiphonaceae bacterium]